MDASGHPPGVGQIGPFPALRLAAYDRPPFTGCGWITPLVNLEAAGPGNAVPIDLLPVAGG